MFKKHRGRSFTQGVVKKVGSLAETMPELAKEWHPIKNGDLTPNDITAGNSNLSGGFVRNAVTNGKQVPITEKEELVVHVVAVEFPKQA